MDWDPEFHLQKGNYFNRIASEFLLYQVCWKDWWRLLIFPWLERKFFLLTCQKKKMCNDYNLIRREL